MLSASSSCAPRAISAAFDALVVGAGPAGSSTALLLARFGWRVCVVHRPTHGLVRTGETLPGASRSLLQLLGVWRRFLDDGHAPSPGTVSWWTANQAVDQDSVFDPSGHAWHVDRQRFDRMLLDGALEAGVEVVENARVIESVLDGDRGAPDGWRLKLLSAGRVHACAARVLIVATGRSSPLAPRGLVRHWFDRLIGIGMVVDVKAPWARLDQRVWIEAAPTGWWYSAPMPSGHATITFFTDADQAPTREGRYVLAEYWLKQLDHAPGTASRLSSFLLPASARSAAALSRSLRVMAADSHRTLPSQGSRWLAVGDASTTWDPLCGQGLDKALRSAWQAARASDGLLHATDGGAAVLADYAASLEEQDRAYRRDYYACYGQVRRWPDAVFWQRRQPADVTH